MTAVNNNRVVPPYPDYRLAVARGEADASRPALRADSAAAPQLSARGRRVVEVEPDPASTRFRRERASVTDRAPDPEYLDPEYLLAYNRLGQGMTAISSRAGLGRKVDFFA
jgi:hypothetical protein